MKIQQKLDINKAKPKKKHNKKGERMQELPLSIVKKNEAMILSWTFERKQMSDLFLKQNFRTVGLFIWKSCESAEGDKRKWGQKEAPDLT